MQEMITSDRWESFLIHIEIKLLLSPDGAVLSLIAGELDWMAFRDLFQLQGFYEINESNLNAVNRGLIFKLSQIFSIPSCHFLLNIKLQQFSNW